MKHTPVTANLQTRSSVRRSRALPAVKHVIDPLLMPFELFDEAVALVDAMDGSISAVTTPFRMRFPSVHVGDVPFESLRDGRAANEAAEFEAGEFEGMRIEIRQIADGRRLLRVGAAPVETVDMRRYLQARDDLFCTSRTISVSEMATSLAHELNQPIGTISNLLGGLKRRVSRGETDENLIVGVIDKALEQARFSQSVIERIRDFTQARRPQQRRLDVVRMVREAAALLDWLLSSSGCRLSFDLPDVSVLIRGDATMLQQVLINLLRNAIDAVREQARERRSIRVSVRVDDDVVSIAVRDEGYGLNGQQDSLFIPFVTSKPDGMGVGLNICRSFIELHQGRLWLAPNDDVGCTAWIELPLAGDDNA